MKTLDELVIKVDDATAKKISERICTAIEQSLKDNATYYKEAERSERQYNQISKWMAQGKVCNVPWEGASDYFLPVTEWVVDAIHARAMNALWSQEPAATAVPTSDRGSDIASGVTDFVDEIHRNKVQLKNVMDFFIKQCIKLPFAVLKYDWAQTYESQIVKSKVITLSNGVDTQEFIADSADAKSQMAELIANGYQMVGEAQDKLIREDIELENQAKLKYIRFEDYVWAGNTKRECRPYWEGDRFWMTMGEIKAQEKSEKYIKGVAKKIEGESENSKKTTDDIKNASYQYEMFHWYGKLPFNKQNEIDFNDDESIEQEVHAIISNKEKILCQVMFWEYERKPYPNRCYLRQGFEDTEGFGYRSMCAKLRMTQMQLNTIQKMIMDNAMLAMMKILVKKGVMVGDVSMERPKIFPGCQLNIQTNQELSVLDIGDIKSIGMQLIQELLNFVERISNISVTATGTTDQSGKKTATEIMQTIKEGNTGTDKFIGRMHDTLREICKITVSLYREYMPEGMVRAIKGESGESIYPSQDSQKLYADKKVGETWAKEDLGAEDDIDFKWMGTRLGSIKELNIAISNDLMERYLPMPQVQGNLLAVYDILKRGLLARGIKDYTKIIGTEAAIKAEMQMKASAENAAKVVGQMETPEQMAAKKLQGMGMNVNPQELEGMSVMGQGTMAGVQ